MIRVCDPQWVRFPSRLFFLGVWLVLGAFLLPSSADAQALEPRSYSNVPVGVNFALAGYIYGQGGLSVDPSVPLEDAKIDTHTGLIAGARSVGFWGKSGMLSVLAPYTDLSGTAVVAGEPRSRHTHGFGDPLLRVSVNLLGAPAMTLKEFVAYRQDCILGVSLLVSAPLGEYDSSRAVNLGANRWSFKPEVGISKALGKWTVEGAGAVTLFTDNHDFYGGQTREQEPIYSAQGHVVYSFLPGLWAALNATYYVGGRTTVEGDRKADLLQNWRCGATLALPITRKHSLKVYASTGVHTSVGTDFDLVGIVWQYRWGGGL